MCCNKYYPPIISPIERITHEFYVSFVIITWYIGTVIGSFIAIHLHTINRSRSELVLLATGISFIICLLIETQCEFNSLHYDYFVMRIVLGVLIGAHYLTSVIVSLESSLSTSTYACGFTIATIISISQTKVSTEISCVSLTLIYSLIALNLSNSNCLFPDNVSQCSRSKAAFAASHLIVKETRPLIYLAGAKLLTVFCFFLPFSCIVVQFLMQPIVSLADDDVNNTTTDQIFNDLVILFVTRVTLGTIAILLVRHNVNYVSFVYLMPLTILLAVVLLFPLLDLRHLIEHTPTFCILLTIYVAFSLFVDIIGHHVTLNADLNLNSAPKVISLTFATFIEHLVDVAIVVIYLNDWISAKLIITSFLIIFLTVIAQKLATPSKQANSSATEQQIL